MKKPSPIVTVAARLICQFFAIFGNKTLSQLDLGEWPSLQRYIRQGVSKQLSELQAQVRQRILTAGFLSLESINDFPELKDQLLTVGARLTLLHNAYFGEGEQAALMGLRNMTK